MERVGSAQDFPVSLAALMLIGLLAAGAYFENPAETSRVLNATGTFIDSNESVVAVALLALGLNAVWLHSVFSRLFGFRKQGSRLQILSGRGSLDLRVEAKRFAGSALLGSGTVFVLKLFPIPLETTSPNWMRGLLDLNFAVSAFVIAQATSRLNFFQSLGSLRERQLPQYPRPKNAIVLGAVNEGSYAN